MWLIIHKQRGGKLSKFSKITHWRMIVYDDHMADNCLQPAWSAKSKVLLFANANVTSVFRPRGLALICSLPISQWVPATWKLKIGGMTFWRQSKLCDVGRNTPVVHYCILSSYLDFLFLSFVERLTKDVKMMIDMRNVLWWSHTTPHQGTLCNSQVSGL